MQRFAESAAQCEYGYVPMQDGTRLAFVIWRPVAPGRYPTIVNYSVYAESGTPLDQAERFLEAGYSYIGVNVRGTGASEGAFGYFDPIQAADGAEIIEWIARQPWSNAKVGMIGASYGAHLQVAVAALRPAHLDAIVPISIDGCEYRDEAMPGGLFNAAMLAEWTFRIQPQIAGAGAAARIEGGDGQCAAIRARQLPNRSYDEVRQHPVFDDWWRVRSLDTLIDQVRVPTLFIQAWQDEWIRPNGAIRLFERLQSTPKKIILQNGHHRLSGYHIHQKQQLRWLDRWVKGASNDVEREPPVTILWEVIEPEESAHAAPSWTTHYPTWPVPDLQWLTLYLTHAGELNPEKPGSGTLAPAVRSYVYPLGTELIGDQEQFKLSPPSLGALRYRTRPMSADTALLGAPRLTLFFSSDQEDTDFMFTLKDIDDSGNVLFLQRSVLNASLRAVDETVSSAHEIVQSFTRRQPLIPGEMCEAKLSLSAVGHILRAGHRLELSILSPGAMPNPVWGFAPVLPASVNTIHHGRKFPSRLSLPVVPGETAQMPAPALGTLRNQPWRPA